MEKVPGSGRVHAGLKCPTGRGFISARSASARRSRQRILVYAETVFSFRRRQFMEFSRQVSHRDPGHTWVKSEGPSALASSGVQVDVLGSEAKKRADPVGDVINCELANAMDVPDRVVDFLKQVVKVPAVWDAFLDQRMGSLPKNDS